MTSTSTSVDFVRNLYAAFARGDIATILSHVSPDCEWIVAGEGIPAAGKYRGAAGASQFFTKLNDSEEITRFEPREYFTNGDDVVAYGYEECRVRSTGKTCSSNWMMLFRVRNGVVTRFETFYDTSAYAAAHRSS